MNSSINMRVIGVDITELGEAKEEQAQWAGANHTRAITY